MAGKLWEKRRLGKPPAFESPEEMWNRAVEYFKWCENNQLLEDKLFSFQGETTRDYVPHIRAMTQAGLCAFLNIGVSTYHDYKKKPNYSEVTQAIDEVMYEQKFAGAAAGLLNANIVARDLGLGERIDHTSSDKSMSPSGITKDELIEKLNDFGIDI